MGSVVTGTSTMRARRNGTNPALEGQGGVVHWRNWLGLDLREKTKLGKEEIWGSEEETGKTVLGRRE